MIDTELRVKQPAALWQPIGWHYKSLRELISKTSRWEKWTRQAPSCLLYEQKGGEGHLWLHLLGYGNMKQCFWLSTLGPVSPSFPSRQWSVLGDHARWFLQVCLKEQKLALRYSTRSLWRFVTRIPTMHRCVNNTGEVGLRRILMTSQWPLRLCSRNSPYFRGAIVKV
jgi:hypothetical protein